MTAALKKGDRETAIQIARSALSVAVTCALDLDTAAAEGMAMRWFESLSSLYAETESESNDITKALKWASGQMTYMLTRRNSEETNGVGKPREQ